MSILAPHSHIAPPPCHLPCRVRLGFALSAHWHMGQPCGAHNQLDAIKETALLWGVLANHHHTSRVGPPQPSLVQRQSASPLATLALAGGGTALSCCATKLPQAIMSSSFTVEKNVASRIMCRGGSNHCWQAPQDTILGDPGAHDCLRAVTFLSMTSISVLNSQNSKTQNRLKIFNCH